ncbi:MAG: tRNA-dihydrouridine synthase family protein [Planctomycetota bacterium]
MNVLPFSAPYLLAPMEGVTEPAFRRVVLAENDAAALGGTFSEFARITNHALSAKVLARHLNLDERAGTAPRPVGLQLMGSQAEHVAASAANAVEAGAPLVDLNFGCPAKGALRSCAGSGMLDDPASIERLVRLTVEAVAGAVPVTGKIRAGGDDDSRVEELARAVENGGAALLSVHCRTRAEKYADTADWQRLVRARTAVSIPVCGNGGIECHRDLERLRVETGCAFSMVARGALRDPWIFSSTPRDRSDMRRFFRAYDAAMAADGNREHRRFARWKQLLKHWTACGWPADLEQRNDWMRSPDFRTLEAKLDAWSNVALAADSDAR